MTVDCVVANTRDVPLLKRAVICLVTSADLRCNEQFDGVVVDGCLIAASVTILSLLMIVISALRRNNDPHSVLILVKIVLDFA